MSNAGPAGPTATRPQTALWLTMRRRASRRSRISIEGVARAAAEYATEYATQRVQFGKPIGQNQAVAFMLADMAASVDAARLLTWRAAWMGRNGRKFGRAEGSMSKLFAAVTAVRKRRADRTRGDVALDEKDRELGRTMLGKAKKKKREPFYRKTWFTAAGISGGATYDGLIALTALEHDLRLLSRDARAARAYRALGVDFRLLPPEAVG